MAGTLVSSVISDGVNSTSTTNAIQGSAKAWVNFNGTNGTIRASYNVSSVTRTNTGTYTVNFTNAMSDANYVTTACARGNTTGGNGFGWTMENMDSPVRTTSAVSMYNLNAGQSLSDALYYSVSIFR